MKTERYNRLMALISDDDRAMLTALRLAEKLIDHGIAVAAIWWHDQDDLVVQSLYAISRRIREWAAEYLTECESKYLEPNGYNTLEEAEAAAVSAGDAKPYISDGELLVH